MDTPETNDAELVAASLRGSRDAFRLIVERYQTLICSLAYCATGSVSQSQDMAQETFLAAWKDLAGLREPEKLKAWLCRIVRNRIYKSHRRAGGDLVAQAMPLEEGQEVPAVQALPCEQAISREEEAILWRSLERIPETYREPLILFYREHQSVESVAAALELSEDAVKQRLSRGRKLLQEEVQGFVENTLRRSAPGREFAGVVLAALPATTGSVATASASLGAKGAATAKSGLLALWLVPLAPFIGLLAGFLSQLSTVRAGTTGRQRWIKTLQLAAIWIMIPVICIAGEGTVAVLRQRNDWSDQTYFIARTGFWWLYCLLLATWMMWMYRRALAVKLAQTLALESAVTTPASTQSPQTMLNNVGIHVAMFLWLVAVAWRMEDHLTAGLVVLLGALLAIWKHFDWQSRTVQSYIRATFGHVGLCCAVLVTVVNLRLDVWLATNRGVSVTAIHQIYPMWLVPVLSVSVGLWIGVLLVLPVRKAAQSAFPVENQG